MRDSGMPLDLPTLLLVSTCVTALLGVFLLLLWFQDRAVRALGYWAAAYLLGGFAIALWNADTALLPVAGTDAASALLFVCCGLIWCGARKFHGRVPSGAGTIAGAVIWLALTQIPEIMHSEMARLVISSFIITGYAVMTALELQRDRRRRSLGRADRIKSLAVPMLHGVVFLSPIMTMTLFANAAPGGTSKLFPFFALLTLLYVVGTAFIVVVMAKEHAALLHKTAAMTDHLTGLFNRRGFFEAAEKLIAAERKKSNAVAIMMFDLDHFKSINDRFGHDIGDEALQAFAATASSNMRVDDIIGRLGGEEFAAILPGGKDIALIVGERVRAAFQARGVEISGHAMNATVSIGISEAVADHAHIPNMLVRADRALYSAKSSGRNRLCVDEEPPSAVPEATPAAVPQRKSSGPESLTGAIQPA